VRRVALLAGLAAVATGCGTPSADLFIVDRDGTLPGAKLHLLVSDGGWVVCNRDGRERPIDSDRLLDARQLTEDLQPLLDRGTTYPAAKEGTLLRFRVSGENGAIRFADTSAAREPILGRLIQFTRRVSMEACGKPR
jgi:hypothetical protein